MSVENEIRQKIEAEFSVDFLEVVNESHGHNVPAGSESHFKVVLAAKEFSHMSKVQRHRAVYRVLADKLASGVHALALHTYSPEEWSQRDTAPSSPPCMGSEK